MKRILSLLTTIILYGTINLPAQDIPVNDSGKVEYVEIIEVENVDKETLYGRAQKWVASYYNSGKEVLQLSDDANKTLIGNAILTYNVKSMSYLVEVNIHYSFEIACKDGRSRIVLSNFVAKSDDYQAGMEGWFVEEEWEANMSEYKMTKKMRRQSEETRSYHLYEFPRAVAHILDSFEKGISEGDDW